jgi:formylglycine-generating enzyme required for sulfatase activity
MTQKELEPKKRLQAGETLDTLGWVPPDLQNFIHVQGEENFWIAKYPVTNWQYMQFVSSADYVDSSLWKSVQGFDVDGQPLEGVGEQAWQWFIQNGGGEMRPRFWDDEHFGALRRLFPVVGVSWYEAAAYCAWLSRCYTELGLGVPGEVSFRLPLEQEWICAFRGQGAPFLVGGQLYPQVTRQTVSMHANTYESGLHRTTPVCMYPDGQNSAGIMDLNGNVWEWQANQRNRAKLEIALRGGAWTNNWGEDGMFPAIDDLPADCGKSCGFRVLMYQNNRAEII